MAQEQSRWRDLLIAGVATLYGLWLVYAAGIDYLLLVTLLYAPGIAIYWLARRQHGARRLNPLELGLSATLFALAGWTLYRIGCGDLALV